MDKKTDTTVELLGIDLFSRSEEELLAFLTTHIIGETGLLTVVTPNPEQVVLARRSSAFFDHVSAADIRLPDGVGLLWAARLLGQQSEAGAELQERITGVSVAQQLLARAREHDWRVVLLGGRGYRGAPPEGSATGGPTLAPRSTTSRLSTTPDPAAAVDLRSHYPELELPELYWIEGYRQVAQPTAAEEQQVRQHLSQLSPTILCVAFGAPHQERWLAEHRQFLEEQGVRVALAVGGSFDFILGKVPRAPRWVQAVGLEWLFRLVQQPWRWRRQLRLLSFTWLVLKERFGAV